MRIIPAGFRGRFIVIVAIAGSLLVLLQVLASDETQITSVRIIPAELFIGDLKRLEPHLGLTTGCLKLECKESSREVKVDLEVWQNGKAEFLGGSQGRIPEEISVKEVNDREGEPEYRVVVAETYGRRGKSTVNLLPGVNMSLDVSNSTDTRYVDIPSLKDANKSSMQLAKPVELPKEGPIAFGA